MYMFLYMLAWKPIYLDFQLSNGMVNEASLTFSLKQVLCILWS